MEKIKCDNCSKEIYPGGTFHSFCHIYCYLEFNKKEAANDEKAN